MTSGISGKHDPGEKRRGQETCKHCFKNLIPPTWKKKLFLVSKCQNIHMFSIELLAQVSRGHADLHSVLCSSEIIHACCVSENLFEYGGVCVGVQRIN